MLHDDIRAARIRAGLSQNKLAQLAKVPRAQLRKLETGGNVTLVTVEKILAHLPDVELTIGAVTPDHAALKKAVSELIAAAQRVLEILGPAPQPVVAKRLDQGPVGATRHESTFIDPKLLDRLEAIVKDIEAREKTGKAPKSEPEH